MNKEDIYELMDRFQSSGIYSMEVECEEFSLKLQKTPPSPPAPAMPPVLPSMTAATVPAVPAETATQPSAAVAAEVPNDGSEVITSPLVGTFYVAPSPGSDPYIMPGSHVKAGDTLCLVEAMKTMNEITAPCDCKIVSVLAEDSTLVSFGEDLIRYVKE